MLLVFNVNTSVFPVAKFIVIVELVALATLAVYCVVLKVPPTRVSLIPSYLAPLSAWIELGDPVAVNI